MAYEGKIGVAFCTPIPFERMPDGRLVLERVTTEWADARRYIGTPTNYNSMEINIHGKEIGDARNYAVQRCLEHNPKPKYLFFLDYDVIPSADCLQKLVYRAEHHPECDIFAGVYCAKMPVPEPLIYAGDGVGPFWDWAIGDILTTDTHGITGVHMGLTLIRLSLFDRTPWDEKEPWFYTANETQHTDKGLKTRRGTEDLWFCRKAVQEANAKILVDTSVLAGHICNQTRIKYGLPPDSAPVKRNHWLNKKEQPAKKAIDIGFGGHKREWDGYRTYTTDIRPDTKPDYVMDSLLLNFPDGEFDIVASSHHLEHLGRLDQEKVWSELFRITKPGGKCEHIVPNAEWAAQKLIDVEDGRDDGGYEDCANVFLGAQEYHGYARHLNAHYMLYTPRIGRTLAENAGYVDVETEDYRDRPELGYNLVIRGRKPEATKVEPSVPAVEPVVQSVQRVSNFLVPSNGHKEKVAV